jgi:hypothetical protein
MKKLLILSLAAMLVVAFTLPASAFESVFNGYHRTRAYSQQNFAGTDGNGSDADGDPIAKNDLSQVDQRSRIGYRAILNDNLAFISNFEFNATWGGDNGGIGDKASEVKFRMARVEFTTGQLKFALGQQGYVLARGFIFDDTALGATVSTKMGAGDHLIPLAWFKNNEGSVDNNAEDVDTLAFYPIFNLGESFVLNPFAVFTYSGDGGGDGLSYGDNALVGDNDGVSLFWLGANADFTLGAFNLWLTGAYLGGTIDFDDRKDVDAAAYAVGAGASVPLGPASLHGQAFYWSGDDRPDDNDAEAFFGAGGESYYWAEILGAGTFDKQVGAGGGTNASNLWAANIGATIQPMEKLSLTGDLWYASLVEDNANNDKELGLEIDLKASYQLVEGLTMDIVGAYLFADDAVISDDAIAAGRQSNDEDPWEVGTRLSLSW